MLITIGLNLFCEPGSGEKGGGALCSHVGFKCYYTKINRKKSSIRFVVDLDAVTRCAVGGGSMEDA